MNEPAIKIGINDFFNDIKFCKDYYPVYNNILHKSQTLNDEKIFAFIILQLAYQTKFSGYFDELYVGVVNRKSDYVKHLINNFRISFIGPLGIYNIIDKYIFLCARMTDKEIYFSRKIRDYDFDKIFNRVFDINDISKKKNFVSICENIYFNEFKTKLTKNKDDNVRIYPI